MKKTTLKVKGMHCKSCEMLIEDSLKEIVGVASAKLDHKKSTAAIEYDETKVNENKIKEMIKKEGYEVI
jgi:Cu+-exporting ATPase